MEMKTLLQIQDEVSEWLGYVSIDKALTVCGSNLIYKICNEAAKIYAEQFKPKWISVEERLPELKYETGESEDNRGFRYSEYVVIWYIDKNEIEIARFEQGNSGWKQWYSKSYDDAIETPDFWMPLPEKP